MRKILLILLVVFSRLGFAQQIDTLVFYSSIFEENRELRIHLPEFYKYGSDDSEFPIIYALDGQHDWFIMPLKNTVRYLQYTHEIPQAIIVEIPHSDRVKESLFPSSMQESTALHRFIQTEVDSLLKAYRTSDVRILIGHSFTASFALYSFVKNPDFYAAVIAHSPLYRIEKLVESMRELPLSQQKRIYLSIGGAAFNKDSVHRLPYERLKIRFPEFFKSINTYEANLSTHTAVPILASPYMLSLLFNKFSSRMSSIARVDLEYALISPPLSPEEELEKIKRQYTLLEEFYPPEIPELNGIISRYSNSDYWEHSEALLQEAIHYYPHFFDFHLQLYSLYWSQGAEEKAKKHLLEAYRLINTMEREADDWQDLMGEIDAELEERKWQP
jgi:predicted alpha/beta superfamily hydrolase